eukprot:1542685-Pyramimonas_sp.AAC.1
MRRAMCQGDALKDAPRSERARGRATERASGRARRRTRGRARGRAARRDRGSASERAREHARGSRSLVNYAASAPPGPRSTPRR